MRNGSYIRALGRQSFEPSQPVSGSDSAGSSTCERSQEMQRSLIKAQNDVLATVGVCRRDPKQSQVLPEAIVQENEVGLLVGAVELTITYLASWPLVGIRNRLQTYRTYEGLRYRDVLLMSWSGNTILQMLSGMPAHLCYQLVNVGRDSLRERLLHYLSTKALFRNPQTGEPRELLLSFTDRCVSTLSWFLVYPLYQHSILQSLHLVPPTPILPSIYSFIPFSSQSPLILPKPSTQVFSLATVSFLLSQGANSYFLFSFVQQTFCGFLQYYFFRRLRRVLPRPNNPDPASIAGVLDPEDLENIQSRWDSEVQVSSFGHRPIQEDALAPVMIGETSVEDDATSRFTTTAHHGTPSAPMSWTAEELATGLPDLASLDTTRQEVRETHAQQHRVTRLSLHPANVFASHAADGIATALSSGLESAVMRTVARSFLLRQGMSPAIVERRVFQPGELRGNAGLVAKALAGEWGLMWLLFEGSYFASTWIAIHWFGYPATV